MENLLISQMEDFLRNTESIGVIRHFFKFDSNNASITLEVDDQEYELVIYGNEVSVLDRDETYTGDCIHSTIDDFINKLQEER